MRSVCQALNLLTTTLGYIVAGALNSIFSFWVTSDLNDGYLEYIFYIMALLVFLNIVAFICVSQSFEYHVPPPSDVVTGFSPALPRAARRLIGKNSMCFCCDYECSHNTICHVFFRQITKPSQALNWSLLINNASYQTHCASPACCLLHSTLGSASVDS